MDRSCPGVQWVQGQSETSPPLPPTKLCTFWLQSPDACLKGDACTFAHGKAELHLAIEPLVGKFTVIHHVHAVDTVPGRMRFDDLCFKVSRCQIFKHVHTQESKLTSHERGRESIPPHWIQAKSAPCSTSLDMKAERVCEAWSIDVKRR